MRAVIRFFLGGGGGAKAPKEVHAILTEILACFLLGRATDLSLSLYIIIVCQYFRVYFIYVKDDHSCGFLSFWYSTMDLINKHHINS